MLATDRGVFRGGNGNRVLSRAQSRHDAQLVPALGPPLLCWARVLLCHQCFKFREKRLVLGLGFTMANLEAHMAKLGLRSAGSDGITIASLGQESG